MQSGCKSTISPFYGIVAPSAYIYFCGRKTTKVIDLNNKTISKINGIPYTDGHSVSIEKYQGKFYFTAYGVDKSGVFSYDPATGAVEHVIDCNSDISYMHIF